MIRNKWLLWLWGGVWLWGCGQQTSPSTPDAVAAEGSNKAGYVGMQTCRGCHADKFDSYIQTGMGRSFSPATQAYSKATFGAEALVYDTLNNYYYRPFLRRDSIYILEYRLRGRDTIHRREEKIAFIVGSGHHTNSHLIWRNGYLYQAPITYYTQTGRWDMAPGFEGGGSERFERWIGGECLTCHNHYPNQVTGSEHKYSDIPLGIACERCHGGGAAHVEARLAGKPIGTTPDIIHPARLPIERQMDLCQRCHLQGVAVLQTGKTFYDFEPGMALREVMDVYLPRFTDSHEHFLMASQADRLRLSPCYIQSGQLSCITCHNPHHDVHATDKNRYNSSCTNCHRTGSTASRLTDCSLSVAERAGEENNCVGCHLPRSGSIDIPHITISDHNISKATAKRPEGQPITTAQRTEIARFLGLQNLTNPAANDLDYAKGYLALYDKFIRQGYVLDSAWARLQRSDASKETKFPVVIHYYFARGQYPALVSQAQGLSAATLPDAWTAYRIGEAFLRLGQPKMALPFVERAARLKPLHLDFKEKWALALAQDAQESIADSILQTVLQEDPKRVVALANLGLMAARQGNNPTAINYYDHALTLDPDHYTSLINKAALTAKLGRVDEAKLLLQRILQRKPNDKQALEMWTLLLK